VRDQGAGARRTAAPWLTRWLPESLARQVFWLNTLTVLVLVVVTVALVVVDARRTQLEDAREHTVAVAEAVAEAPTVLAALRRDDPSRGLQTYAERVRRDSGTDFVVVMGLDRTRYSHPDPDRIGEPFIGDLGRAAGGEVFVQEYTGTLGRSVRAVVPVFDGGEVVALVSSGITLDRIDRELRPKLAAIVASGAAVLGLGAAGAWLVSRRLRRQTHGMGPEAITRMYEYYDAVLHAVREGLLLVDDAGRVQLVNDEASRLLDLTSPVVGRSVRELGLPDELSESLTSARPLVDETYVLRDRVLVVNQAPARWQSRQVGWVVTLRDRTELQAVTGELDTVRGLADSLRSQNHEAANRLHTVVSLIEMGRPEEAVEFATEELATAQALTDRVVAAVEEPVVAALLLGKTAQAAERGVDLRIADETRLVDADVAGRDLVTVLGNLVDNAIDAANESGARRVDVSIVQATRSLTIRVEDSGPGLREDEVERIFERGWSTKGSPAGDRGIGLALVAQVVRRHGGTVEVSRSRLGGAAFEVRL
jgi:sensor histidine kinase regulating citrate/malate metabolism